MTEKQVNKIREKIQKEALKSIIDFNGKALILMATGAGKSKIPIDYAKKKKAKNLALIVPTENLKDNWEQEFKKWGALEYWENTTVLCYASASKIKSKNFDLVILDECHNITELSSEFFIDNTCKDIIGLTATKPKEAEKVALLNNIGLKVSYHLPLDEAVKLGFVAPYKITVIYTRLDSTQKYIPAGTKDKPFLTTEAGNYNYLNDKVRKLMFSKEQKSLQYSILHRMRAIYNLKSKTSFAKYLLEEIIPKDDRTLIFSGNIEQAEEVCLHSFHSKSKNDNLELFKQEKINRLSCVNSLNEGQNIPNLDSAIIVQLNSNERNLIQRIGRLIRYRPGHQAHIYVICCLDTQDEKWLEKALENLDKNNIEYKFSNNYTQWKFQKV